MKRKQFTFYASFFEAMSGMGMYKRGIAITLMCNYALHGMELPPLDGKMKMYMDLVRPNLEAGRKKALAGQVGASVTNRKRGGKKENEMEKEMEIEHKCVSRDGFERFWDLYPVKIAQEEAWAMWKIKNPDPDTVIDALGKWKNSRQWIKDAGQFVPRAAKFLEQEYYLQTPDGAQKGVYGHLGKAELEAIENIMREDFK